MTTVTIDDELETRLKAAAEERGQTLDAFVGDLLRSAVAASHVRLTTRNGLPVFDPPSSTPAIDPDAVCRALQEEGP